MKRHVPLAIIFLFLFVLGSQWRSGRPGVQAQSLGAGDCLACHSDASLAKEVDGKIVSLHTDENRLKASVHASLDCASCHSDVTAIPHEPSPAKVNCSTCHSESHEAYARGLHAKALENGHNKAASCLDCHGDGHSIRPSSDPSSKVFRNNIPQTCGACHGQKFVMEESGISAQSFFSYKEGVHGRAVAAGNSKAAICTDCHSSHEIRSAADPLSAIFKFNVPQTCGQCHGNIAEEFGRSIHGQSIRRGNWQSPVCTDCHGIHLIKPHIDPTSSVASQALAKTTCAQCHEGVRLSQEFGFKGGRASSYLDSYHGLASKWGSAVVANCASCHGVHNILPSTDSQSTISQNNLVQTCGKCHPGAGQNFALGKVHLDLPASQDVGSIGAQWVRSIYLTLIAVVIGFMVIHNGLIWGKKALARRRASDRTVLRMSLNQRVQHMVLLVSFIVLVLTGFALKYPDSWFAMLLGSSETIRSLIHRIAAVGLIAVGAYHAGYLIFTKEGRQGVRDLLPARKDFLDLIQNLRYYLGRSSTKARIGRFGYPEKMEYWAVVWGVLIMGLTGLMVWFKVEFFGFLPRWSIDIALAIHFYEAILATLAIIVWHFYQVIFDPDVYPINWAWLDGRVSEEHLREEHPIVYELQSETTQSGSIEEEGHESA